MLIPTLYLHGHQLSVVWDVVVLWGWVVWMVERAKRRTL